MPLVTTYDYDNAGQLIDIDYSDTTPDVEHTYNRRGQIAQTIDAAGTRVYTYNDAGQMLTEGYTAGIMEDLGIVNVYDAQLRRQSLTAKRDRSQQHALRMCMTFQIVWRHQLVAWRGVLVSNVCL